MRAQQTYFLTDPESTFKQAKEYFQKDYYSLAYPLFKELHARLREADRTDAALNYDQINYYTAVCGLAQNDSSAVAQAQDFIQLQNDQARVGTMSYFLAEYYFRRKDFSKAASLYENTNIENLSDAQVATMKFHQGYAYFYEHKFDQAKSLLDAIRQLPKDPNYIDANYYYGFIAFYEKNYSQALIAFRVVENQPVYDKIVPYYIANIYVVQNQQEKAVQYAAKKLSEGGQYYEEELKQLTGHGYYEEKQFDKALPYLEQYVSKSKQVSREDLYELSYCYYQTKQWDKAIAGFRQLSGGEDSLSQNAMYLLGDAYLTTGQKSNARNAFLFCSSNSSNPVQKEISQFNYAKLSYELDFQNVALDQLKAFLRDYPNSPYAKEAKELLLTVLTNTNSYRDGMALMDSLGSPTESAKRLYPRILFGRATELINDGQLAAADALLDKARSSPYNASVLPFINFWKGEIAYRQNRIDDAIPFYFDYLKDPTTNGEVNPSNARYDLGYCFLKKENYRQAQGFFEEISKNTKINSSPREQDAYVRNADCYYMQRDFKTAEAMYTRVIDFSWPASDYATFQKAMIAGVSSGKQKIDLLNGLIRKNPGSPLIADANMEIAVTYLANEQFREALPYLKNVINTSSADALKPRALLRSGIAWYNLNNNKEALNQYTTLLKQYPNSPEAQDALENAKSIYIEEGNSGDYVNFAKSLGVDISSSQEDQLSYQEAEVQFNNGNFNDAAEKFEQYLAKYPNGKYSLEANYYKSEIYYNQKNWTKAATGYEAVGDKAPNKFAERSLLLAARLDFFNLKDYAKAEKYFGKLKDFASSQENKMEAMRGLLRSQFELQKWSDAVANANDLLGQKGLSEEDQVLANMVIAKSLQSNDQCDQALQYFRIAASLSKAAYGAEARYQIAECLFEKNELKDAEKSAFDVINKSGSYEMWVTKSYLLLGDIYVKEKDYFNAKATYQSVSDNARIEELRQQAKQKLSALEQEERKDMKVSGEN